MLLAVTGVNHVEVVITLLMDVEIPTEGKELDLKEFGNTDNSQKSDLLILLCQQKLKDGSFSLISRQSQRSVLYLVASNNCHTLFYVPRKAVSTCIRITPRNMRNILLQFFWLTFNEHIKTSRGVQI